MLNGKVEFHGLSLATLVKRFPITNWLKHIRSHCPHFLLCDGGSNAHSEFPERFYENQMMQWITKHHVLANSRTNHGIQKATLENSVYLMTISFFDPNSL